MNKRPLQDVLKLIIELVHALRLDHNKWIVRALVVVSLPMIAQPLWEPYIQAIIQEKFGISVVNTALPGWILFAIGIALHLLNRYEQRHPISPDQVTPDPRRDRDIRTLRRTLETIHTPTFDQFLEYGKASIVWDRIFHFWEGFHNFVENADFFMSDKECAQLIEELRASWGESLSFGEWFTNTSNPDLYKFDHRYGLHDPKEVDDTHQRFTSAIWRTESALRTLLNHVFEHYPELDTELTNAAAWNEYVKFQRSMDERIGT